MSGAVPALDVRGLRVDLESSGHPIVIDVDLSVAPGEVLGIVGESGSGKTTAALAALGFARAGARISGGSVSIGGSDILSLSETALRGVRGQAGVIRPTGARIDHQPIDPRGRLGGRGAARTLPQGRL